MQRFMEASKSTICNCGQFREQHWVTAFLCAILSLALSTGDGAGTWDDQELTFEIVVGMACLVINSFGFYVLMDWRGNRQHSLKECRRFLTR